MTIRPAEIPTSVEMRSTLMYIKISKSCALANACASMCFTARLLHTDSYRHNLAIAPYVIGVLAVQAGPAAHPCIPAVCYEMRQIVDLQLCVCYTHIESRHHHLWCYDICQILAMQVQVCMTLSHTHTVTKNTYSPVWLLLQCRKFRC